MLTRLGKLLGWRPGIIYAYSGIHPIKGTRIDWIYVGKTRQKLESRHAQHMGYTKRQDAQPWSDLYPSVRVVFYFKACPEWWLNLVEKWTIKWTFPLFNYQHNLKNPRRIPKYEAVAQRVERDRLRGTVGYGRVMM